MAMMIHLKLKISLKNIAEQDKKEHKFELYLNELEDIKDR